MKRDEAFDPTTISKRVPFGLVFRSALREDCSAITQLMHERNPTIEISQLNANTNRELDRTQLDSNYKLFVTELNAEVVGFCRFYHSAGLPAHKKIYASPEGWYGMGLMVDSKFRRQNIAHFISLARFDILKEMGVKELYSVVDSKNLTSMMMHQKFGYHEIARGDGFLHLKFDEGCGVLLVKSL